MNPLARPRKHRVKRQGSVIALFAILLPVVLVLCGVAINIAYMQLTRTELQVATDAAARAAGRAFSEFQDVDAARDMANSTASLNMVAGEPLTVSLVDEKQEIQFGEAARTDSGYGRYSFSAKDTDAVRDQSEDATAIRITGRRDSTSNGPVRLFFAGIPLPSGDRAFTRFEPVVTATATQLDRDIALILDRSGSMAESTEDIDSYIDDYSYIEYYYDSKGRRRSRRVWTDEEKRTAYYNYQNQYDDWADGEAGPPDASRWRSLEVAVNEFLDVLGETDQEERVSVATFSTTARLDLQLVSDVEDGDYSGTVSANYDVIRDLVADTNVGGWTAIGQGLEEGLPTLLTSFARPYAAKTIVVLTDGINNQSPDPVTVTEEIVGDYNVTIHTVTFSHAADQSTMTNVAEAGGGKHYHAETTEQLVDIFREIANNLPTIITE